MSDPTPVQRASGIVGALRNHAKVNAAVEAWLLNQIEDHVACAEAATIERLPCYYVGDGERAMACLNIGVARDKFCPRCAALRALGVK